MPKIFAEFSGIFFLTVITGIAVNPLAVGLVLAGMIYVAADFYEPHFNPAVSLAAWLTDNINSSELVSFLLAQFSGGLTGALFLWWLSGTTYYMEPAQSTHTFEFIAVEVLFTFLFILVFLFLMYPRRRKNHLFGLMIGLMLTGCLMVTEPVTGTGLNPFMSSGFSFFDWVNNGYSWYNLPIYMLAPLVGSLGGAFVYRKVKK